MNAFENSNALTAEQLALISCRVIREIDGCVAWRFLSKPSKSAIETIEEWIAGKASLKELEAVGVLAEAAEAAALLLLVQRRETAGSKEMSESSAALWAARAVSRAVDSVLSGSPVAVEVAMMAVVRANTAALLAFASPQAAAVVALAAAKAAKQEIAGIVREVMSVRQ